MKTRKDFIEVQVKLEGKALEIVLFEQSKRNGNERVCGKSRLINILLTDLYERRVRDSIVPPVPMNNKEWKKYLKT